MRYLPFIAGKPDGSREGRHSSAAIGEPGAVCFVFSVVRDIASIAMSWALEPIGRKPMASGPPVHGRELSVEETAATFRGASSVPPQTCYGGKRNANGIKCRVSANLLLLQASRWEGRVFEGSTTTTEHNYAGNFDIGAEARHIEAGKLEVTQGAGTHLFGGMQRERADCGRLGGFKATL